MGYYSTCLSWGRGLDDWFRFAHLTFYFGCGRALFLTELVYRAYLYVIAIMFHSLVLVLGHKFVVYSGVGIRVSVV